MRGTMTSRNPYRIALFAIFIAGAPAAQAQTQPPVHAEVRDTSAKPAAPATMVPVTTSSPDARQDYEMGMVQREDLLFMDKGLDYFRKAVKADPRFAVGHAALAYFTVDAVEEHREEALAKQNLAHASPDEKQLIRWMLGARNGELVPAVASLNDLLRKYPDDKRLGNLAAEWLCSNQEAWERGESILENLLKKDPNYFPALNNLAYCYALSGRPALAPALMDQYVVALPNQPNPEDSYGEISRMLGNFPAALEHYGKALKIDSTFTTSQLGIASTFALMGEEERARAEYLKAIPMANERQTQTDYRILWALTYYRENQLEQGRAEFTKIAADAHSAGFALQEAEAHRDMALFNPDPKEALTDLEAAQAVLSEKHPISRQDRENELATILQTRAFIAARAGLADVAQKTLGPLSALAKTSRSNPIQHSFHSASGATLLAQGKFEEAIAELQEDPRNPLSLELLSAAQNKAGHTAEAQTTLETLAAINDERVETAFAVPQARAALKRNQSGSAQGGASN